MAGATSCVVVSCTVVARGPPSGFPPPTSASRGAFLEGNLLGFEGDLYDSVVEVVFLEFLRPSRAFSSIEELERTVLGNIDWVANNVGRARVEVCA